jgi:putative SOS response-associated peptidase YedK
MCGRFNITDDPSVHSLLKSLNIDLGPLPVRYNLAPTDQVPVIHHWEGERLISDMRWWLVPHWTKSPSTKYAMFNARYESLETSRAYQGCFRHKRCIIPAHSFVEWHHYDGHKTPYLFSAVDSALAFAGIWDYWSDGIEHILSCAIITTDAAPEFKQFHTRMPVMLDNNDAELWLDETQQTESFYPLFEAKLSYPLHASSIDTHFKNSHNKEAPILLEDPKGLALE